ncbi:MAG: hypothetical protein AAGI38_17645 [Bacteroidota bacterium]
MPTWLTYALVIGGILLVSGGLMAWVMARVKIRELHENLAKATKLKLEYASPKAFQFSGNYGGYPAQITPETAAERNAGVPIYSKVMLPMVNPNDKYFSVNKASSPAPWQEIIAYPGEKPVVPVTHELGDNILLQSNDLWFSSILLNEAVKQRLQIVMGLQPAICVAIKGEELFALIPRKMKGKEDQKRYAETLQLLADMKDALQ